MSIITLLTDYGLKDHFVGALKGKLLTEFKEVTIVDVSHSIDPFNISEASYILSSAYASFPKNTVHLIGVDIERNKEIQHIAMQWNDHFFVGADNGILSILTEKIQPQKIVALNFNDRLMPDASATDVFVKTACHLAKGGAMSVIGKEITSLKKVTELQAVVADDRQSIKGYVIYIDHFGNAVTNISKNMVIENSKGRKLSVHFKNKEIKNIYSDYSEIGNSDTYVKSDYIGFKMAVFNEAGFVEIAVYKSNPNTVGSANSLLGLNYRDQILIQFEK
jgi:S-adenosylmethionine hydrolase